MQTISISESPSSIGQVGARGDSRGAASDRVTSNQTLAQYQIIRRNGAVVPFEPGKIAVAMMKAFLAVHGTQGAASASVRETVDGLTQGVVRALMRSRPSGGTFHIEDVQDQVELGLMRSEHHEIARAYVLYRERRTQERAKQPATTVAAPTLHVIDGGKRVPLDLAKLQTLIESSCANLGKDVTPAPILSETLRNLYDGVPVDEVYKASILAARTLIEKDPDYTYATSRLLMHTIRKEILGEEATQDQMGEKYPEYFPKFIKKGVENELLDERLLQFDLKNWVKRSSRSAICSLTTSACKPCMTATFCMCVKPALKCRKLSSCAWPWACRSTKSTAKRALLSSMRCCPRLTLCPARQPCLTVAPCARSCLAAT
jgi:hypothetical protein